MTAAVLTWLVAALGAVLAALGWGAIQRRRGVREGAGQERARQLEAHVTTEAGLAELDGEIERDVRADVAAVERAADELVARPVTREEAEQIAAEIIRRRGGR